MEEFFNKIKESFIEVTLEFETINIKVNSTEWIESHKKLRDEFNLKFFFCQSYSPIKCTKTVLF